MVKKRKRTFQEIRLRLLKGLISGQRPINELARVSGVNWKTTELHMTYLSGRGLVHEAFNSPYVRIFEITELGKELTEKGGRIR